MLVIWEPETAGARDYQSTSTWLLEIDTNEPLWWWFVTFTVLMSVIKQRRVIGELVYLSFRKLFRWIVYYNEVANSRKDGQWNVHSDRNFSVQERRHRILRVAIRQTFRCSCQSFDDIRRRRRRRRRRRLWQRRRRHPTQIHKYSTNGKYTSSFAFNQLRFNFLFQFRLIFQYS